MMNVAALYQSPEERPVHEEWVSGLADELLQDDAGAYVGFLTDEGEARVRAAYPGPTWDRLREVKRKYDPENVFRLNQNVPPAEEG
jgi:FAD/FMN-containing dehydrogenase